MNGTKCFNFDDWDEYLALAKESVGIGRKILASVDDIEPGTVSFAILRFLKF